MPRMLLAAAVIVFAPLAYADGPKDNVPDNVRPVPPKGVAVSDADRKELADGLAELGKAIDAIPKKYGTKHPLAELLPDVEIYHKAVRYALEYGEFFNPKEVAVAKRLLKDGLRR